MEVVEFKLEPKDWPVEDDESSEVELDLLDEEDIEMKIECPELEDEVKRLGRMVPGLFGEVTRTPSTLMPFDIELIEPIVVNVPPYRYSAQVFTEIMKQTDNLYDLGIIELTESGFSNPRVMVRKRGGTFRLCLDFRKLNEITKPEKHPLPLIDELVGNLEGQKYFATLDLSSVPPDSADGSSEGVHGFCCWYAQVPVLTYGFRP